MAAYGSIDFSVVLDNSGGSPLLRGTDGSTYGGTDAHVVSGYFEITQPDGNTVTVGSFASPSVAWVTSALTVASTALRLATNGQFQNGVYTITYYQRVTGYDDNSVTKQFTLSYERPAVVITPGFDLFTPLLKVTDATNYVQSGLTVTSTARTWSAVITDIGTLTGTDNAIFNLADSGDYYDAEYISTLSTLIGYSVNGSTWAALIDRFGGELTTDAYAPPTVAALLTALTTMWENMIATGETITGASANTDRDNYEYAFTLYQHYKLRGAAGAVNGLYTMLEDLKALVDLTDTEHSGDVLTAYTF